MSAGSRYAVHLFRDFAPVAPLMAALAGRGGSGIPFQDTRWLSLWYKHFAAVGIEPLIAVVTEGEGAPAPDNVAMALPLVRRRKYLLPLVEFADRGITDYNLPFEGPRCPRSAADMRALVASLQKAVRPFALLRLSKMPREVGGRLNPFALLDETQAAALEAHNMVLPRQTDELLAGLSKKKRTEIGRIGRILDTLGEHRFAVTDAAADRAPVFDLIRRAQRVRVPGKNERYFLEDEGYRQFYDALVLGEAAAGFSVVSAIWLDGRPVAGLLGVRSDDRYVGLRIGVSDEPEIARLGLGKILLFRTAEWAIGRGIRVFDFSLGGTALKAWFHPEPFALVEYGSILNGIRMPQWLRPSPRPATQEQGEESPSIPG